MRKGISDRIRARYPEAKTIEHHPTISGYLVVDGVTVRRHNGKPVLSHRPETGVYDSTRARFPDAKTIEIVPSYRHVLLVDGVRVDRYTGKPSRQRTAPRSFNAATIARWPADAKLEPASSGHYIIVNGITLRRSTGRPKNSARIGKGELLPATIAKIAPGFPEGTIITGNGKAGQFIVDGVTYSQFTMQPIRPPYSGQPSGGKRNLHARIAAKFPHAKDIRRDPANKNFLLIDGVKYGDRSLNPAATARGPRKKK